MKQYDKLYLPDKDCPQNALTPSTLVENVIVMTIEELREVWNNGYEVGFKDENATRSFLKYTQNKGINI